jgi:copper chaperone CopZ
MRLTKNISSLGILTAIAASLCCITPVLAALAGISGLASTFSWLEPARPYFIGATVVVLGFAWYQQLRDVPADAVDCDCDTDVKPSFWQSRRFLGMVSIAAALLLAFPSYASVFFPATENTIFITSQDNIQNVEFTIKGMTCTGCEQHVKSEVNKLDGIIEETVSYEKGNAIVQFDKSKTSIEAITAAINATGYQATQHQIKTNSSQQ